MSKPILQIWDEESQKYVPIPAIKGKDGKDGARGKDGTNGANGTPGKDGKDGTDGITPTIGDNGNWYLGSTDTGKPARGPAGDDYTLTADDKQEIAALVLAALPDGDEVSY